MAFSPREVAEQLTVIDAELFQNVVPSEYLGSTWGKRNQPGHENVAPTVRATVVQFNRVANCVMTSCLGDPNMTAQGRAKVLERWIEVARECQALRNFSSLYAIVSALQSMPIYRLNKTWGKVSRKSCRKFKKLCDEDNSLSWELLIKKQPSKFATLLRTLQRGQKRQQQKSLTPAPRSDQEEGLGSCSRMGQESGGAQDQRPCDKPKAGPGRASSPSWAAC
nr:ral guanine nucleotide dissociation stimulator-like isoform X2 [Equus asinus]